MIQRVNSESLPIIFIKLLFVASLSFFSLSEFRRVGALVGVGSSDREALYLPKIEAVKVLSFGYPHVAADLFWFQTINYFGKHYRSDGVYPWLSHMCNLVTELNPSLEHVYYFCGAMLSWEAKRTDDAVAILKKGVTANPDSWKLPYLLGFTEYYFNKDAAVASQSFIEASKKPGAPLFVQTLAAKTLSLEDKGQAIVFLQQALKMSTDEASRDAIRKKLAKLISEYESEHGNRK